MEATESRFVARFGLIGGSGLELIKVVWPGASHAIVALAAVMLYGGHWRLLGDYCWSLRARYWLMRASRGCMGASGCYMVLVEAI